jgi:hypothetical protein
MLKFKRKLSTCDNNDYEIKTGTVYMIFTWNNQDPNAVINNWNYNGANRMTKTIMLLDYKQENIKAQGVLPADTKKIDLRMNNVSF